MDTKLDENAIKKELESCDGWKLTSDGNGSDKLEKTYIFLEYNAAIGFIMRVSMLAEKMNHHPDFVNNYKNVTVCWTSHSVGGVTNMDFRLAKRTDECACGKVA